MLSIDGLITGIDTATIIEGLLSIQNQQVETLETRKQAVVEEQTAFSGIEARLLSFQGQIGNLARIQNSVFSAQTALSSDEENMLAAATDDAAPGVYNLRIEGLARAHQVASQGFERPESAITQGSIEVRVGAGANTVVTIDDTNDTLQGLTDAINNSGAEVSATIITDNGGGSPSSRLLLTANRTGAANAITLVNNLSPFGSPETPPVFDVDNPVQAAADATIVLGSGDGAIKIQSETNQVEGVLAGVTLDLLAADSEKDIRLTVEHDTEAAKIAITDFVDSYNGLMEFIDEQTDFNAASGIASPLLGDRSTIQIQDDIRAAVTGVVPGVDNRMNRLSALGISVNSSGRLTINSSKLDDAVEGRVDGINLADVRRLFTLDGQSDNGNIEFLLGSTQTKDSTTAYQVDIIQAAEQARVTAANSLATSTVISGSNNSLSLQINGKTSSVLTLSSGTYTRDELAEHLQTVINADEELPGRAVNVALEGDQLQITSTLFGTDSEVTILSGGSALATLGLSGSESDRGLDVVGKYLVDGVEESATGNGRLLVGDPPDPQAEEPEVRSTTDLQVRVTLTQSQVQAGPDANLTVSRGLASRLDQVVQRMLESQTGRLSLVNDQYDERIQDIEDSIDRLNENNEIREQTLLAQFRALESAVSELQTAGSFLAAQLGALPPTG